MLVIARLVRPDIMWGVVIVPDDVAVGIVAFNITYGAIMRLRRIFGEVGGLGRRGRAGILLQASPKARKPPSVELKSLAICYVKHDVVVIRQVDGGALHDVSLVVLALSVAKMKSTNS